MRLPDHMIKAGIESGELGSGFNIDLLQPASIDVRLGPTVIEVTSEHHSELQPWRTSDEMPVDPLNLEGVRSQNKSKSDMYTVMPGKVILASTVERIAVPSNMVGELWGKSTLGRHGLAVHVTAGYLDPGFNGHVTLELAALHYPIRLTEGMRIGQIAWSRMVSASEQPYGKRGNHYQNQCGDPVPPKPMGPVA